MGDAKGLRDFLGFTPNGFGGFLAMLNRDPMPLECSLGHALGRELYSQLAHGNPSGDLLSVRYHLLGKMLGSNPLSVFDIVPCTAAGANGLLAAIRIRDNLGVEIAAAANRFERDRGLIGHDATPLSGDSAPMS